MGGWGGGLLGYHIVERNPKHIRWIFDLVPDTQTGKTLSVKWVKSLDKHVKDIEEMHQYPHNRPCFVFLVLVLIKTTKKERSAFG